jgi:dihydrofolate reductase
VTKVIAGMTISVDGFVTDRHGDLGPLYTDLESLQDTDYMRELIERTGSVLMGRRSFEVGDPDTYADNYELQAPIFVVTHQPPAKHPKENDKLTFTFVTDGIESATAQARAAAGDKDVQVIGGADLIQQLLRAGLVDELNVDVMPLLLGSGTRLFDGRPGLEGIPLEKLEGKETGARTTLRFRVGR